MNLSVHDITGRLRFQQLLSDCQSLAQFGRYAEHFQHIGATQVTWGIPI